MKRRSFITLLGAAAAWPVSARVQQAIPVILSAIQAFAPNLFIREGRAQTPKAGYPTKPVRMIVPVAAGGPTDIVARMLAGKLSAMWGQQVFIENKPAKTSSVLI